MQFNIRVLSAPERASIAAEVARIESYPDQVARASAKGVFRALRADGLPYTAAIILKQELLRLDAEGIISPQVYLGDRAAATDAIMFATLRQYTDLVQRLRAFGLPDLVALADQINSVIAAHEATDRGALHMRGRDFRWGERTYIMGIINTTPDSFSGDGLARDEGSNLVQQALAQAQTFVQAGVHILDVGGESTRPGADVVSADEERSRVLPVITALRREFDVPISIDTWKAEVAASALDAGADMINDVWGLRLPNGGWDTAMARLVAQRNVPLVIMHNRQAEASSGAFGGHYRRVDYADLLGDMLRELRENVQFALEQGIAAHNIIVDPGIGFGKTPTHNIEVLRRLSEFRSLGYPLLLATSRKSFIGKALGNLPPQERDEGTAATVVLGIQAGADIVRVHDVARTAQAARMADAIVRVGAWERLTADETS